MRYFHVSGLPCCFSGTVTLVTILYLPFWATLTLENVHLLMCIAFQFANKSTLLFLLLCRVALVSDVISWYFSGSSISTSYISDTGPELLRPCLSHTRLSLSSLISLCLIGLVMLEVDHSLYNLQYYFSYY